MGPRIPPLEIKNMLEQTLVHKPGSWSDRRNSGDLRGCRPPGERDASTGWRGPEAPARGASSVAFAGQRRHRRPQRLAACPAAA